MKSQLSSGLFIGTFLLSGVLFIARGVMTIRNARISANWPQATGEVIASSIRTETNEDGTVYHADVVYKFVADDQWWEANSVFFGATGESNRPRAAQVVERYPVGERVTVFYNPADPETAVLEPGLTFSSYVSLIIGVLILGIITFVGFQKARS